MRLVIAEKPSVARDITAVIGATEVIDGAIRGNGYIVTSARGHLVRFKEPQEYDSKYSTWKLEDLPIMPPFEFVPIEDAADVLDRLTKLMNSSEVDEIICATDAGREGECIFRYIYDYIGCKKPYKRLWISSLTAESIKKGFEHLLSGNEKDKMYKAGLTRAKIDWLWGMNLTRLYTKHLDAICTIGRVQTAVVNMIVQRDKEITDFVKKPFYKLKLDNGAEWFDKTRDYFTERSEAETIKAKCSNADCKVISVKSERKKENRPLLYSLTSLQIDANEKVGFSAATTLAVMQTLYEKKLLTYPRTDSNYLTDDMTEVLADRVNAVMSVDGRALDVVKNGLNIDSRIINNNKVSDHHAIIPTENIATAADMELSADEKTILNMVITRFLAALSGQYDYEETEYIFEVSGETFRCKSKVPKNLGWRRFYDEKSDSENVMTYSEGDTFKIKSPEITEGETQPPKRYSESMLLKTMENIDRRIEDKELAEYVSERGLGTPATRASIIEHIIRKGYVERKGKQLIPTEKGKMIMDILPDEVKSVEMTATMELQLKAIENGTVKAEEVVDSICKKINDIIELERGKEHISLAPNREVFGCCPKCGGNVYKYANDKTVVYYCENSPAKCFFRLYSDDYFFTSKGKTLTDSIMKALLLRGKTKLSGLKSPRTGGTYDAVISFKDRKDKNNKTKVGFDMTFVNDKKSVK